MTERPAELTQETVLNWLAGLSSNAWLEFMTTACAQRHLREDDDRHFAMAHIWRFPVDEPWVVELVGADDAQHYNGHWSPEDCSVIRSATCETCGSRVGSWARCPVCGQRLDCY